MGKKQNKVKVVKEFIETMTHELSMRFGSEPTIKDIVYHFVEKGIAKPTEVRNYLMLVDFDKFIRMNGGRSMLAFSELADKYEVTERQAQTIIYSNRTKFSSKETIK